jgi:hypothetical protein
MRSICNERRSAVETMPPMHKYALAKDGSVRKGVTTGLAAIGKDLQAHLERTGSNDASTITVTLDFREGNQSVHRVSGVPIVLLRRSTENQRLTEGKLTDFRINARDVKTMGINLSPDHSNMHLLTAQIGCKVGPPAARAACCLLLAACCLLLAAC